MEKPKPKILISIHTLESGGAERVVSLLLQYLQFDFDIHLALFTNIITYQIPGSVKIIDLKQPLYQNKFFKFFKIPWLSYKIFTYCKKQKINTSISFLYRACFANALLKVIWQYKGRVIMCERIHQSAYNQSKPYFYKLFIKLLVRLAYNKADLVLANSQVIKEDLKQNYNIKRPIQVIYNPVDIKYVEAKSKDEVPYEFDKNIFYFIHVGGFRPQKNISLLVQAFSLLKGLPCKLILIGGGILEEILKQEVINLNIRNDVFFGGWDTNPFKYISRSNCLVLSSNAEGFPNVILETLACGKAVISTDCSSGPRELLAPATDLHCKAINSYEIGEYGILTPVNDVKTLSAAMKKMYEDTALRKQFEEKAKGRAQQFDVDEIKQYFHVAFTAL
jgi:N-acetylgalactosamine-N,N'-diacetylbacillosaminyl-diphospho-undecaprenol 4-alpha-N-acetylgalactosaminyltransferase